MSVVQLQQELLKIQGRFTAANSELLMALEDAELTIGEEQEINDYLKEYSDLAERLKDLINDIFRDE